MCTIAVIGIAIPSLFQFMPEFFVTENYQYLESINDEIKFCTVFG